MIFNTLQAELNLTVLYDVLKIMCGELKLYCDANTMYDSC